MKRILFAAGMVCGVAAGSAQAASMDVTYQVSGKPFGTAPDNWVRTVNITSEMYGSTRNSSTANVNAGLFRLVGDNGGGDFNAFCVDLAQYLVPSANYTLPVQLFSGVTLDNLDRLYTSSFGSVNDANTAAAFQIAIWEIIEDSENGLDLTGGGAFKFNVNEERPMHVAIRELAQGYLDGLDDADVAAYNLTFLQSDVGQDLVVAEPIDDAPGPNVVPLPASALGLLAGLAALAGLGRRRRG